MKAFTLLFVLLLQLSTLMGGELIFKFPKQFYAHQHYESSSGMSFEAKVYRLNQLVRIELMTEDARGAYTILDVSKKLVHLVYPDKRQFLTLPYFGPSESKEFVDETFLYFQSELKLTPMSGNTSNNLYQLATNGKDYEIVLNDNELPHIMIRKDENGSSSVEWVDLVIQEIDPNLFRLPEGYTEASLEDLQK